MQLFTNFKHVELLNERSMRWQQIRLQITPIISTHSQQIDAVKNIT